MAAPEPILQRLAGRNLTILVENRGRLVFASDREGSPPLIESVLGRPELYDGSDAALPAIGLAAACLLIHAKVGRVFAATMTQEARRLLQEEGIEHAATGFVKKLPAEHQVIGGLDDQARAAVTVAAFVEELKRQRA